MMRSYFGDYLSISTHSKDVHNRITIIMALDMMMMMLYSMTVCVKKIRMENGVLLEKELLAS